MCLYDIYSSYLSDINLTMVSKNTYITGILGSFQTPNPQRLPHNKYVTYLTTYVIYITTYVVYF